MIQDSNSPSQLDMARSAPNPLLEIRQIQKSYGDKTVLHDLSLSVNRGELVCLLGPNGAGKTTTMRIASGFLDPMQGSVLINGHDIQAERKLAQAGLGYLPEGAPGYEDMSAAQLFAFVGRVRGLSRKAIKVRTQEIEAFAQLSDHLHKPFRDLSKGFRRRVALGAALFYDPPVLILDEPTDGLDPNQKRRLRRDLVQLAKNKAILVSTHILEEVPLLSSRVVVLHEGRAVFEGSPAAFEELGGGSLDQAFAMVTGSEVRA